MALVPLVDLPAATLHNKRGHQKGWIAKAANYIKTLEGTVIGELKARDVARYEELLCSHHEDYKLTQNALIQVMEKEDAREADITKEMDDLGEHDFAFMTTLNNLKEWETTITTVQQMKAMEATIDGYLTELKDDPELKRPGARHDLDTAMKEIASMRDLNKTLQESRRVPFATIIKVFNQRLTAIGVKDTASVVIKDPPTVPSFSRNRLPDHKLPKYHGDKLKWPTFLRAFTNIMEQDDRLTEADKINYLKDSVKTSEAEREFSALTGAAGDYEALIERFELLYHDPRLMFRTQIQELVNAKTVDRAGAADWHRTFSNSMVALEKSSQFDALHIMSILCELKLSGKLREDWIRAQGKKKLVPELSVLLEFLDDAGRNEQQIAEGRTKSQPIVSTPTAKPKKTTVFFTPVEPPSPSPSPSPIPAKAPCKLCSKDRHPMFMCTLYKDMNVAHRKEVVQRLQLCNNCLGYSHTPQQCRSTRTCRECHQQHHSSLHEAAPTTSPPTTRPMTLLATSSQSEGTMPTAIILLEVNGRQVRARAVLDPCSTDSYITANLVKRLQAPTFRGSSTATGVGGVVGLKCDKHAVVTVHPRNIEQRPPFLLKANVSTAVSLSLPFTPLTGARDLPFLQGLDLADPSFHSPGRIDLLLGLQGTGRMATRGIVENYLSEDGRYQATSTIYGWIVQGWKEEDRTQATVFMTMNRPPDDLREFWLTEEHQELDKTLSKDENEALAHFSETVTRDQTGRYIVRLPRKTPTPELGHSRQQAEKRFNQNRRSLVKKQQWTPFCTAVQEYGQLNHAERVPRADLTKPDRDCYYLPMHGVTKESSTSTKLRVVFDASARSSNGISLNDTLLPGPNQYPLITDVLLKFRKHNIGMTADISKMFREVGLHPSDRDFHRFLWLTKDNTLEVWRMTRVTFGVTSSPFLATQTLRQLATDYESEHSAAARIVRDEFYVDDCITGADTTEQAIKLRSSLNELLHKAGMKLRKWRTSSNVLQTSIPSDLCEEEAKTTLLSPKDCHKTLGIHWDVTTDQMFISTPDLGANRTSTKRQVSSDLARTFDVMGWFSPSMVIAKLIIQELWVMGLSWDEQVPDGVADRWSQWTNELPLLTSHPIRRCYYDKSKKRISTQLHGFCDASEKAFGGVIYLRTFYEDTTTTVSLMISKTRVAPIKTLTIPKLELCGAVLLSKLLKDAQRVLEIGPEMTYAWTDSTVVLGWLNHNPGRLKVFVANRILNITSRIGPDRWRYVPTSSNPADVASRGLMPQELISHKLWWEGPEWLSGDPGQWPCHPQQKKVTLPEVKTDLTLFTTSVADPLDLTERFSTLNRLLRTTAWIRRFICNIQNKDAPNRRLEPRLTTVELVKAEQFLVKHVQQRYYSTELETLSHKKEISSKSSVRSLYPLLDREGILRVGGRLEKSQLPFPSKHPIILPRQAHLVQLIIRQLHTANHHVGASTLIGLLAEQYHITGVRTAVRTITKQCVICRRTNAKRAQQLMGQLPSYRTTISPVFSQVGTDFAGPIIVKSGNPRKPRKTKSFICLFICMATKAVHVELVSDLTTSAFMAALHRFSSRRGLPHTIHSDNGTNYLGADNELKEAYDLLNTKDNVDHIQRGLADLKVNWSHTPARAPHFGGLWESTVKCIKSLLKKTVCQSILTFEELTTVLCQIEATLNSRPLVPLHAQPPDGALALTPGHFLTGRSMKTVPDMQTVQPGSTYKRWNLCQQLTKNFWDDWTKSYLTTLNQMNRWTRPQRNIKVGDVVLIKDLELFTNVWPLALVTEVHPGTDGLVRAATVKNQKGIYRRPVVKLTLLLPEDDQTDQTSSSSPGRMDAPMGSPHT